MPAQKEQKRLDKERKALEEQRAKVHEKLEAKAKSLEMTRDAMAAVVVVSPQLMTALWVSRVPASLKGAAIERAVPSSTGWSAPASSTGATLATVTSSSSG